MSGDSYHRMKLENEKLRSALLDVIWMARRYANRRSTFAPRTVNEAIDFLDSIDCSPQDDIHIGKYCEDGDFGTWNSDLRVFERLP